MTAAESLFAFKEAIGTLRFTVYHDHLYLGGGNAKLIRFNPGPRVTVISNEAGIRGGIVLWQVRAAAKPVSR